MNLSTDTFLIYKNHILNHNFFKAHEVFEEIWFPIRKNSENIVKILRGFINCAVSFELLKRGRLPQSKKVYQSYLNMIKDLDSIDIVFKNEFVELKLFLDEVAKKLYQ